MTLTISISEDEFDARFPLIPNHLRLDAGWSLGDGSGCLFETYGDELDFVQSQDPRKVWTLVDGDDGRHVLCSGVHGVNRIGYLVSTIAVPEGVAFEVHIPPAPDASAPTVLISVRGGTIEDIDSTSPLTVVVEDWDVFDEDTGSRPLRTIDRLAGGMAPARAERLRRLIHSPSTSN